MSATFNTAPKTQNSTHNRTMEKHTIQISSTEILQRIYTHTYYTGEARKYAGVPANLAAALQASDSNKDILLQHIQSSIAEAARILTRYLGICTTQHNHQDLLTTIIIETPSNYPAECIPQIAQTIEEYSTMRALEQWLAQNKPDEAVAATREAELSSMHLRELTSLRRRPLNNARTADSNIEL